MFDDVQFERRLFASVVALAAALPILLTLLPEYVADSLPVIGAAAVAVAVCAVPVPSVARAALWGGVLVLLAPLAVALCGPTSPAVLVLVPLGLVALTSRPALAYFSLVAAAVVVVSVVGPTAVRNMAATGANTLTDAIGWVAFFGWAAATLFAAIRMRRAQRVAMSHAATVFAIDEAMARDRVSLMKVADVVADPTLKGPVLGAGLGDDGLGLAVRLDHGRVLLGWLDGPPLATLSAGWALAVRARAGEHSPRALLRFAKERLDETLPGNAFRWLAVWDRTAGSMNATVVVSAQPRHRCALTPQGPRLSGHSTARDAAATIHDLLPTIETFVADRQRPLSQWIGAGLATAAALGACFSLPLVAFPLLMAALLGGHTIVHRARQRAAAGLAASEEQIRDRSELHDDLRFRIARLHSGLLQYQVRFGGCQATAHRLRGEVLEGSFADLVLDPQDRGHVVAGEVAGRGIAARFLGLAAQMVAHHHVANVGIDPRALGPVVAREIKRLGDRLGFPGRLRLGSVTIDASGNCEGAGVLKQLVVVRGVAERSAASPLAPAEIASVTDRALLDDDTRVYLSPAAALPGPEDDAPPLGTTAAADRIESLTRQGQWHPRDSTLPSLFSLVFDGRQAPAHGTLIELASLSSLQREKHDDRDEQAAGDERAPAPRLAAI